MIQQPANSAAAPAPILVVDDDYQLRTTIQILLEEEGFAVQTAADGREAVELALARQPSLVILDMGLPLLNGSEVAGRLRAHYGSSVPFLLITADGQAERKSRLIGAARFLRKPFLIDTLLAAIHQVLRLV